MSRRTYLVPFLAGDGTGEIMLTVTYIAGGFARDVNGECAFCHGDPLAETSPPESLIARYWATANARWDSYGWGVGSPYRPRDWSCPMCDGRAA